MTEVLQAVADLFRQVTEAGLLWVAAVYVLVWLWGELGLTGKAQLISSFATGLVIGVLVMIGQNGVAMSFQEWMNTAFYGIFLGGLASGAHDAIKQLVAKATAMAVDRSK